MTCPRCGCPGTYVGLFEVYCPNEGCDRWSPKAMQRSNADYVWGYLNGDPIEDVVEFLQGAVRKESA